MLGYYIVNIALHSLIVCLLYKKVSEIATNKIVGVIIAAIFSISNLSLYSIVQVEGFMELMCTFLVLMFISSLYDIMHSPQPRKNREFYKAIIILTILIFTHERFVTLTIPLILVLFIDSKLFISGKQFTLFLLLCWLPGIVNFLIKRAINIPFFMGTGGRAMAFEPITGIRHIFYHIAYMFGLHPNHSAYLNGITRRYVYSNVNFMIFLSILSVTIMFIVYFYIYTCNKKSSDEVKQSLLFAIVCLVAVGSMIASSSFTIRVEQRWVQAPYLAALFLLSYMVKFNLEFFSLPAKKKNRKVKARAGKTKLNTGNATKTAIFACLLLYLIATFSYSVFYRRHFENIFFFGWHNNARIIHEEILTQFRDEIPHASTVVIDRHGLFLNEYERYTYALLYLIYGENWRNLCFTAVYSIEDIDFTALENPLLLLQYDYHMGTFVAAANPLASNEPAGN